MPGAWVAMKYGYQGPNFSLTSACATGNHAIGEAAHTIRRGAADVMVCGSAEASIVTMSIAGFNAMRALSTANDDPPRACRPFDKNRCGFVMGEGAGVLILESLEHAQRRGAHVYAEMAGYGATADAYHLVAPDPEGHGAAEAMRLAIEDAGLAPEDIDYINAHGTGTELNDPIETRGHQAHPGKGSLRVAISSTKAAHRAPARRSKRPRSRDHLDGHVAQRPAADHQPHRPRSRVRSGLCAACSASGPRSALLCQTALALAGTTRASCS